MDDLPQLTLGVSGWSRNGIGYSRDQVVERLTFLLHNNYNYNGGRVMRQIMGLPMDMPAAPQIANISCYPVEKNHSYRLGRGKTDVVCRYIDDIYSAGVPLPSQEEYGMAYTKNGRGQFGRVSWSESVHRRRRFHTSAPHHRLRSRGRLSLSHCEVPRI